MNNRVFTIYTKSFFFFQELIYKSTVAIRVLNYHPSVIKYNIPVPRGSAHAYASSTSCGTASILARRPDSADEWECVIQLSFPLFCPPKQIFVATIAFLLPGAEHSTVEADKKVRVGKERRGCEMAEI